jgi:hypothetical protein
MSVEARASWNLPETLLFEGHAVRFGSEHGAIQAAYVLNSRRAAETGIDSKVRRHFQAVRAGLRE